MATIPLSSCSLSAPRRVRSVTLQPLLRQAAACVEVLRAPVPARAPAAGGRPAPRRWKQFLLTLAAIYPLTMLVPWLLQPLFARWPALAHPLLSRLLVAVVIVALMTWMVMPRLTRAMAGWLVR